MHVAKELVFLGWALMFEVIDDRGRFAARWWKAGRMGLFSVANGTALYLVPVRRPRAVPLPEGKAQAKGLFRAWSAMDPREAFKFKIPDDATELLTCGDAAELLYLSDKWSGRATRYVHHFSGPKGATGEKARGRFGLVRAYCDRPKRPRVFGIMSTKGARLVTPRGIVG